MLKEFGDFFLEFPTYIYFVFLTLVMVIETFTYLQDRLNYRKQKIGEPPKPLHIFVLRSVTHGTMATLIVMMGGFIIRETALFLQWLHNKIKEFFGIQ